MSPLYELDPLLPAALLAKCETRHCEPGSTLFLTGERPRWMFFVTQGEVLLERHSTEGGVACLQRCHSGFVGEASLTSNRYHCDARATSATDYTRIPIQALRNALRADAAFSERWIGMLSREVRRLRLQNERLSLPKVQDRLLHLIETEGQSGQYTPGSSLKTLAQQLAVSHEALYRALADLERSGRLERSEQTLRLKPA